MSVLDQPAALKVPRRAGQTTQSVKRIPCEQEGLHLIPQTPYFKKLAVVAYSCNPSIREEEMDRSLGLGDQTA